MYKHEHLHAHTSAYVYYIHKYDYFKQVNCNCTCTPIECSEFNEGNVNVSRGDGLLVCQSGYSKPIKVLHSCV